MPLGCILKGTSALSIPSFFDDICRVVFYASFFGIDALIKRTRSRYSDQGMQDASLSYSIKEYFVGTMQIENWGFSGYYICER